MISFNNLILFLALKLILCVVNLHAQNCTLVNKIYKNAKIIHANQMMIDQTVIKSGIYSTEDDPNFLTFGEDGIDPMFLEEFERARIREDVTRLWQEIQPNANGDLDSCIASADRCPRRPAFTCKRDRSLTGVCNNPNKLTLGASLTPYRRLFPADYEDNINTIRRSYISKSELPSPRIIGNKIKKAEEYRRERDDKSGELGAIPLSFNPKSNSQILWNLINLMEALSEKHPKSRSFPTTKTSKSSQELPKRGNSKDYAFSLFGFMFAQLVSHDMANRALTKLPEHQCCRKPYSSGMSSGISSPLCYPINVPIDDPFYRRYNLTCLNFVRTYPIIPASCKFGASQLATTTTAFIDLSIVYGNSKQTSDNLRTLRGGRIQTNAQDVLPVIPNCGLPRRDCFQLGDSRINQTPPLALLHSLMLRAHNRNARELAKVNPSWSDGRLFTESRRLTIAIYQHIVFHEWLPLLLGEKTSYKQGILCKGSKSKCRQYDSSIDSSILSDFMQGTYRALHVCTPEKLNIYSRRGRLEQAFDFSAVVSVTDILNHQYNGVLRGMLKDEIECKQLIYNEEIRSKFFILKNGLGTDLFSIDVHRGREHGVAPYHRYYTKCTGTRVRNWTDLRSDFTRENLAMLSKIYESVNDMDLVIGTMLENRDHTMTGVVARCVMGIQFHRLKYGDRYFYSFDDNPRPFTEAQINAIESMRMSTVLCQTTNVTNIQTNPFIVESRSNPAISCEDNKYFNYSLWKGI